MAGKAPRVPREPVAPEAGAWSWVAPALTAPLPEGVTLEAVVEQFVRGTLKAFASLPADQRPANVTVALIELVVGPRPAPPAPTPPGAPRPGDDDGR